MPPTSTYRPVSFTTEKLAPSSEASPWGSAPASESVLATLTPPVDQLKLTSVWEPPPVLTQNASNPAETLPAPAFILAKVPPISSDFAQEENSELVPCVAADSDPE